MPLRLIRRLYSTLNNLANATRSSKSQREPTPTKPETTKLYLKVTVECVGDEEKWRQRNHIHG